MHLCSSSLAMNLQGTDPSNLHHKSPLEDFPIKKLLLSHDPDGRYLDSDELLQDMESIMLYVSTSQSQLVPDQHFGSNFDYEINNTEIDGKELFGQTIFLISNEMHWECFSEGNLHERTMNLFELVGNHKWDAKAALVFAAFALNYFKFWLLMHLHRENSLALSIVMLKQLPTDLSTLKPLFKALTSLIKTMIEFMKLVIKFEGLPLSLVELEGEAKSIREIHIYPAVYWIIRSILTCSSKIADLKAIKPEQYSDSTIIATWELSSLANRLRGMSSQLKPQVEHIYQKTEPKLSQKLFYMSKEIHDDNQKLLRLLFATRDDFPLIDCFSQKKIGLKELENKVVILLITKPEFLPIEQTLLLVQQTYDHLHIKTESHKFVWIPVSISSFWTEREKQNFKLLSHSLPFYSIRKPWTLGSALEKFTKQAWNYKDDPIMVVLDSKGNVSNFNAIDMVFIWGVRAYPFSDSRKEQLLQEQNWTLQLLVDEIDPLLSKRVEERRNICIYGSDNINWIRELNSGIDKIKAAGYQIEMVYAGKREPTEEVRTLASIQGKKGRSPLSLTQMRFFWLRLESMRRSKGNAIETDRVRSELEKVFEMDENEKGWAAIGGGSSVAEIVTLEGSKLVECIDKFPMWEQNVRKLGVGGAIRNFLEPPILPEPCDELEVVVPYREEEIEATMVCEKCKHVMNKFVKYV
ncbi:hypothetical protein UlMin_040148 [Ulmus minor]